MKIDYTVHLPATNDLALTHRHGHAAIDDMKASVDINFRHGEFRAGDLGTEARIDMAHSKGYFGNTGNIDASIEVYLCKLEDEILNISAHGSNYSNLSVDDQDALRR